MFMFFVGVLTGILLLRTMQVLFIINYGYKVWKLVELYSLKIMSENEQWRSQALTILKLCYQEANKENEYENIEKVINNKHQNIQNFMMEVLIKNLPYEVSYKNLEEAVKFYSPQLKELANKEKLDDKA